GLTYGPLATTSRVGFFFAGWWTGVGGAGTQVLDTTMVTITADQTLYAKWALNAYTVTFDAQGGTAPIPPSKLVTFASTYGALATTSRAGYVFDGWWTAATGGSQVLSSTTVTNASNHTLYAQWTELPPVPVASLAGLGALLGLITITGARKMRKK
ncbi:MAG: InlB B-repeat-containing protein, partial [Candidatus Hydrogenedentes bacterium]|nr:InlB B-repeat-containing protein [Candidatus Hydrogenedentota bacterium]